MRFRIEQHAAAAPEAVEEVLLDPAFLDDVAAVATRARPELLDQVVEGDRVRRRIRYRFTAHLSPAARAVLDPERLTWVEESVLDRKSHLTTFRVVPDHYGDRLESHGTYALAQDGEGGGTTRTCEGEVRVRFPFVAGQVEKAVVSGLREHAAEEAEMLARWLTGTR